MTTSKHPHSQNHQTTGNDHTPQESVPFVCKPNHLGWVSLSGDQTESFLQGQLSCDVSQLSNGQATLGAYCDPKGRVIATFFLLFWQEKYGLLLPKSNIPTLTNILGRYAPFSKVTLSVTEPHCHYYCSTQPINLSSDMEQTSLQFSLSKNSPFQFSIIPDEHTTSFESAYLAQGVSECHADQWQRWLIEQQITLIEPDTSEKCLPQMLNLEKLGAVSFTKGCFVGQEVIARTQHLGKLKRHLHTLTLNAQTPPLAGDPLRLPDDREAGIIMSVATLSDNTYQLLAVIPDHLVTDVEQYYATQPRYD
ncbi:MAG: hypothetical protein CMF55_02315 [Legionellales bacterium]|nr:hypothetical protein [Legionellales bacterium]HAG62480.1 hypothetical protein [Coxiellaceae bacterium]